MYVFDICPWDRVPQDHEVKKNHDLLIFAHDDERVGVKEAEKRVKKLFAPYKNEVTVQGLTAEVKTSKVAKWILWLGRQSINVHSSINLIEIAKREIAHRE